MVPADLVVVDAEHRVQGFYCLAAGAVSHQLSNGRCAPQYAGSDSGDGAGQTGQIIGLKASSWGRVCCRMRLTAASMLPRMSGSAPCWYHAINEQAKASMSTTVLWYLSSPSYDLDAGPEFVQTIKALPIRTKTSIKLSMYNYLILQYISIPIWALSLAAYGVSTLLAASQADPC